MTSLIDSINQTAGVGTSSQTGAAAAQDIMGKEDFLTLLVAQLQNQDPLNPDEPTEFTAQLAQFSSLEQLFNMNESLDNLIASNTTSDNLSTLSTIGKDVAYYGDSFSFSGEPVELGYNLDGNATEVTLSIELNGVVYATIEGTDLTPGNHFFSWDGMTDDGTQAPLGEYNVILSARAADGESVGAAPIIRTEVTGVDLNAAGGSVLITANGEVSFSAIIGVYEAGAGITEQTRESTSLLDAVVDTVTTAEEVVDTTRDVVDTIEQL
jgi:flagellar basal-body rod modification protein FlgD